MTSNGAVRQQAVSNDAEQQWTVSFDDGYVVFRSVAYPGRSLSASNANSGSIVGSAAAVSSALQLFDLISTDATVPNGTYQIRSAYLPNNVLDVQNAAVSDGANVQVWGNSGSGAQKWNITRNSDGSYTIENARSHKVLEIANGNAVSGNNARLLPPTALLRSVGGFLMYRLGGRLARRSLPRSISKRQVVLRIPE